MRAFTFSVASVGGAVSSILAVCQEQCRCDEPLFSQGQLCLVTAVVSVYRYESVSISTVLHLTSVVCVQQTTRRRGAISNSRAGVSLWQMRQRQGLN
eukprot:m.115342 g.115342  ORF g.115342 m.115342 type:complete len:97 (-) comp13560_c0_seq1:40-330(-)